MGGRGCSSRGGGALAGQKGEQREVEILRSLPGVGRIVRATLPAEASRPPRPPDCHALRILSGIAPVTRHSGNRCIVIVRKPCHVCLRDALYRWALGAAQYHPVSHAK